MNFFKRFFVYIFSAFIACFIAFSHPVISVNAVNTSFNENLQKSSIHISAPYITSNAILAADSNWYNVAYNKAFGYLYYNYLTQPFSNPNKTENNYNAPANSEHPADTYNSKFPANAVINAENGLNMRVSPGTNSQKICVIPAGKIVSVLSEQAGWSNIVYEGELGYCSSDYLTYNTDAILGEGAVVASSGLNMRASASVSAKKICTIPNGARVELISYSLGGWYLANYNSNKGYISSQYIRPVTQKISRGDNDRKITINVTTSGNISELVPFSKQYLGVKYVLGGASPSGFDCSGFVQYVYKNFGYNLPRTAYEQSKSSLGYKISKSELVPGDLVFFKLPGSSKPIGHVGIYIGNGDFIHASSPGDVVKITSLSTNYYTKNYVTSMRILP